MLDKFKRSSDTCPDTPEESRMATSPKPTIDVEADTDERIVRKISRDPRVIARIKQSIADSENGRVVSRDEATEKLKKRAS
jgi:predicted transcriptional regulator